MQTDAPLRLITDEIPEGDPIPLERRQQNRRSISGRATVIQAWGEPDSRQNKIGSFELKDICDDGLGAISQEPIQVDTRVTVFIPPHGPEGGYDLYGTVVWCERGEQGYEVGVRLDQQMTACA